MVQALEKCQFLLQEREVSVGQAVHRIGMKVNFVETYKEHRKLMKRNRKKEALGYFLRGTGIL